MADTLILHADERLKVTLNGTVSQGDLLAHDGTNWVQADASDGTLPAQLVALQDGVSGDKIEVSRSAVLSDSDSPYTQDALQFLDTSAGGITETRPSSAGNLVQAVGSALSTDIVQVNLRGFKEEQISVYDPINTGSAAAITQLDDGSAFGVELQDASANAIAQYSVTVPDNAVGVSEAWMYYGGNEALDSSDTWKVTANAGVHDDAHDANSDSTTGDFTTTAADDINRVSVSAAFDGAGVVEPGGYLSFSVEKEAEGAVGEDPIVLGFQLVFKTTA